MLYEKVKGQEYARALLNNVNNGGQGTALWR